MYLIFIKPAIHKIELYLVVIGELITPHFHWGLALSTQNRKSYISTPEGLKGDPFEGGKLRSMVSLSFWKTLYDYSEVFHMKLETSRC